MKNEPLTLLLRCSIRFGQGTEAMKSYIVPNLPSLVALMLSDAQCVDIGVHKALGYCVGLCRLILNVDDTGRIAGCCVGNAE
jgi:hypothetical protein